MQSTVEDGMSPGRREDTEQNSALEVFLLTMTSTPSHIKVQQQQYHCKKRAPPTWARERTNKTPTE